MIAELLRKPQATIARIADDPNSTWPLPMAGFFFLSFAQGNERLLVIFPSLSAPALILLTAAGALALGCWMWAGVLGGALHLSASLLRGREGVKGTIRAVGLALFWPGLVAAVAAATGIALGYRGNDLPTAALIPLVVQLCAGLWALYTIVAAIRARHAFSWGRAVFAYLLPIGALFAVLFAYLLASGAV